MQTFDMNKKIRVLALAVMILLAMLLIRQVMPHKFSSVEDVQACMDSFGIMAPVVLTLFQAFQVVVPVVPGYLGCAAGAVMFGTGVGFVCNYIGISGGSIIAFFLARKYGLDIVLTMFSEKQYEKWKNRIEHSEKSYERLLFMGTLLPMFPDDFLCYFSGLIRMDAKRFIWIIILGKPWCILAYSVVFGIIG